MNTGSLPSSDEAKIRAWLQADRFDDVYKELNRLASAPETRASPRIPFLDLQAMLLEMRWSQTLAAGQQRDDLVRKFLVSDYVGSMCETSNAFLGLFGSSGAMGGFARAINNTARKALGRRSCAQDPTYGPPPKIWPPPAKVLVARIVALDEFIKRSSTINLPS